MIAAPSRWRGHAARTSEAPKGEFPAGANDNRAAPASALIAGRAFHFLISLGAVALFVATIAAPLLIGGAR